MDNSHTIDADFYVFAPRRQGTAARSLRKRTLVSLGVSGLFAILSFLRLHSAPFILSAECIPDGNTLLSGNNPLQG